MSSGAIERALIYADSAKLLHLRAAASASEVTINSGGNITAAGVVRSGNGSFSSTTTQAFLSAAGGTIYFQPNGLNVASGQAYLGTSGIFYALMLSSQSAIQGGLQCKAGDSNTLTTNWFNIRYLSSVAQFFIDNTFLGNISFTSDYRIKKDVTPLGRMWETVKALKPISYTHCDFTPPLQRKLQLTRDAGAPFVEADDIERWGFLAHELQETLVPSAATAEKDADNAIQSPNPWTVIAALTSALQEAMARIEALEAAG